MLWLMSVLTTKSYVLSEMFAFAKSLKRQEIKLISPNANISLLSIKASAPIFGNMLQPCTMSSLRKKKTCHHWADCLRFKPLKKL